MRLPLPLVSVPLLVALFLGLGPAPAEAQEGRGFAELRGSWAGGSAGQPVQIVERLRPSLELALGDRANLVVTVEAGLHQGRDLSLELRRTIEDSDFGPLLEAAGCTWPEYRNEALRLDGTADYLDVDRLYLDLYLPRVDLRIGRQAVHWGSAQFLNPTDPFPEVLLAEPWRPRRGVNALRASVPLGGVSELSAVLATDDTLTKVRAAGRLLVNVLETDVALVGGLRGLEGEGLVGLDLRGTLGVGWWVESAWILGASDHLELAAGVDYSFPVFEQLVVVAQYYRNGGGETHPDRYRSTRGIEGLRLPDCSCAGVESPLDFESPDPFAPVTAGRDYLLVGANAGFDRDLSATFFVLQNLNDGTAQLIPTLAYVLADWWDVSLSAQVPLALWGEGGEFSPREGDLVLTRDLGPAGSASLDLSGLVPDFTLTLWTRASF